MAERQKTTVYLEPQSYSRLKFLARETAAAPAELIRTAIDEFLERRSSRRLPRSLGAGRSSTGDLSERAEEYLRGFGESESSPPVRSRARHK
jgi:predicted transcriptional regulator